MSALSPKIATTLLVRTTRFIEGVLFAVSKIFLVPSTLPAGRLKFQVRQVSKPNIIHIKHAQLFVIMKFALNICLARQSVSI